MSKHSSVFNSIPSVLSIPEKLSDFIQRITALRFPLGRHFFGRDVLLTGIAGVIMILASVVKPLVRFHLYICIAAMLIAAVPIVLQGYHMARRKRIPMEEGTWLLAAVLAILIGEHTAAPLILIFADLLMQVEAYSLLHKDAAYDYLSDALLPIRQMVENADIENSPERKILATASLGFYVLYLLAAVIFAILALFHMKDYGVWLHRCLVLLVLASPSAFLFSSLLTHFGAVYSAAKANILFAGDELPEVFSRCKVFAFSKTGTVTDGRYIISEIVPAGVSEQELLRIAAVAESRSDHPIALALKAAAGLSDGDIPEGVVETKEIPGRGVSTFFSGHHIYVGNAGLLEDNGIWYQVPSKSGSAIHIAVDSTYRGYIMLSDAIRDNAFETLEELRALGASTLVMLTGDVRSTARTLASSLNFDMVKPELRPQEKGAAIRYLRSTNGEHAKIAGIGDGYHDTEMFKQSDVSVCLEPKNEAFFADISIFSDKIIRVPLAFRICRMTERTLLINTLALAVIKIILAVLGTAAILPTGVIAALDSVAGVAATIYGLTCLTLEKRGN